MALSHSKFLRNACLGLVFAAGVSTHTPANADIDPARLKELKAKWGTDWAFSGIQTFAHLPHVRCLTHPSETYDIAIIGVPFDTAVSYRPGARFGPRALRQASARQLPYRAFNPRAGMNPYASGLKIVDCGDIPVTPFDNALALRQMSEAYLELGTHSSTENSRRPKLVTLGGDHSVALPALRALRKIYGKEITVLHFDAHMDTWHPARYPSAWFDDSLQPEEQQSSFTHGSMFWLAGREGLISGGNKSKTPPNVHAGLRSRLGSIDEYVEDSQQGWHRIASDDISADLLGPLGVAARILETIGTEMPVYLSVDIDVIDPGLAPATGTPEPGGWTTRELVRCLRALSDLNVVGADLVEVSPLLDGPGEQTALAGQQVIYEIITNLVLRWMEDGGAEAVKDGGRNDRVKEEL